MFEYFEYLNFQVGIYFQLVYSVDKAILTANGISAIANLKL